jgi:hypothetical protein
MLILACLKFFTLSLVAIISFCHERVLFILLDGTITTDIDEFGNSWVNPDPDWP